MKGLQMTTVVTEPINPTTPAPVSLDAVVKLIIRDARQCELDVSAEQAVYVDDMLARAVSEIRAKRAAGCKPGECVYILTEEDMMVAHYVLDNIMPDEAVAAPGSAHEALARRHLRGGELSIRHTFAENLDNHERYCAIAIGLDTVA